MDDKTPDPVLLDIQNLNKSYGDTQVLSNCRLQVRAGEILALLGASGCGKSTLLRLIAGLESPDNKQSAAHQLACDDSKQTKLYLSGQDIMHWPPYRRPVNMMFQSYALFPHLNVRDNIAFGLRYEQQTCARLNKAQQKLRVNEVLALVKLEEQAKRYPHQLSGGQCQRVALARALVKQPQLLLLDEPMAALDHQLRQQTQKELRKLQQRLGISFILVTHDRTEAMAMADRIAIMDAGRVVQIDTPKRLYEQPNSRFVAEFLGAVNCFPVQVLECAQQAPDQARGYRVVVECDFTRQQWTCWHHQALAKNQAMDLMVRPEQLREVRAPNGENHCEAQGVSVRYLGDHSVHELCYAGQLPLRMKGVDTQAISAALPDHQYHLAWSYDAACLLPRGELVDG